MTSYINLIRNPRRQNESNYILNQKFLWHGRVGLKIAIKNKRKYFSYFAFQEAENEEVTQIRPSIVIYTR